MSRLVKIVIIDKISILIHSLTKVLWLDLHLRKRHLCLIFHWCSSFILFRAVVIISLNEILLRNHHWLSILMILLACYLSEFRTNIWARSWLHLNSNLFLLSYSIKTTRIEIKTTRRIGIINKCTVITNSFGANCKMIESSRILLVLITYLTKWMLVPRACHIASYNSSNLEIWLHFLSSLII
jgi:hypothetical protein